MSQEIDHFALGSGGVIRTYTVNGPEANILVMGGPPNTVVGIQAWLFLHQERGAGM